MSVTLFLSAINQVLLVLFSWLSTFECTCILNTFCCHNPIC